MADAPALPPAYVAEIVKQENIIHGVTIAFLTISLVTFLARIYVRAFMSRRFGLDDWFMCAAMIMYSTNSACDLVETYYENQSLHGNNLVSLEFATNIARLTNFFYALTVVTVKLSIGFFFLNIFTVNQKIQRGLIYGLMGFATLSGVIWAVMIMGTCGILVTDAICPIQNAFNSISITWSVLNAISDLVFTSLAVQALWRAQLKPYVKASAMALLGLACIGGSISIIRAVVNAGGVTKDPSLEPLEISRWSTIEGGIYITTGCLVTLRPLLQSAWRVLVGTDPGSSGHATSGVTRHTGDASQFATNHRHSTMVAKQDKGIQQVTTIELQSESV